MVQIYIVCKNNKLVVAPVETVMKYGQLRQLIKNKYPDGIENLSELSIEMVAIPEDIMLVALLIVARGEEKSKGLTLPPYVEARSIAGEEGRGVIIYDKLKTSQVIQLVQDLQIWGILNIYNTKEFHVLVGVLIDELSKIVDDPQEVPTEDDSISKRL